MMAKSGFGSKPVGDDMLEARKLSAQVQLDPAGKIWTWLSFLVGLFTLMVLASIWIGANFEAPPPDQSQEKMTAAHAEIQTSASNLEALLAPEQELTVELLDQIKAFDKPLTDFGQLAAVGLRLSAESQDTQTWPGKINAILDDIKIVSDSQESIGNYFRLRDAMVGLFKPKGPVNPKQLVEGSAARAFYTATMDWSLVTLLSTASPAVAPSPAPVAATGIGAAPPKLTWAALVKGQPIWREINGQLDALEAEAKQTEDAAKAKIAKEILTGLDKNEGLQNIRKADDAWSKLVAAQERLKVALSSLPPEPKVILNSPPWHWSRLAFPGTDNQGLLLGLCLVLVGMVTLLAGAIARRNHLRALSSKWLTVTQQLESAVRAVDVPLVNAVQRIDALSSEFGPVLDKLKMIQQSLSEPADSPPKTMEAQAWSAALRIQAELESDLNLIREKLLNIHLQFCSGQTHENLVYDLAFTTEAVQTVFNTARDLGRSIALLNDNLQQVEAAGDGQDIELLMGQVNGLRNNAKRIAQTLQELSSRLQVAVEDVPKGRRFEADLRDVENGRLSVNQPI